MISRSHQIAQEGFNFMFDKKLVTVWSVPNYCYKFGNLACVMAVNDTGAEPKFSLFSTVTSRDKLRPIKVTVPYFL
ncbi:MAG: hypothetical protein P4M11_02155 [Candidatus Pacebacteria bacterium]|nr:hypothetical protein [Candidatus Paceibacterota bacterium]